MLTKNLFFPVEFSNNSFSYVAKLKLNNISPQNTGNYTCNAVRNDNTEESESIFITVAGIIYYFNILFINATKLSRQLISKGI